LSVQSGSYNLIF